MSHRLQVLIPEDLDTRIANAAQRSRTSKGAWVRRAIEAVLERRGGQERGGADPLLRLPNVVVVPHIASATYSTRDGMAEICADNLIAGVTGRPLRAWVNPDVADRRRG